MSDSSDLPAAPPPTLIMTDGSTAKSYNRHFLLSLATPQARPPNPERVRSFSQLLRNDSCQWGVDENVSTILGGCISPAESTGSTVASLSGPKIQKAVGGPAEILFNFKSPEQTPPVLVDFTVPNPFDNKSLSTNASSATPRMAPEFKASNVFQSFPGSKCPSQGSLSAAEDGPAHAQSFGDTFKTLRLGARLDSMDFARSRSSSITMSDDTGRRASRLSSISSNAGQRPLNAFAAPWPLPKTTPTIHLSKSRGSSIASSPIDGQTLPLPKPSSLPSSLPAKPNTVLPPVFVKRETAALPQSMALPDIAPLGKDWEGENSLSGNDKRRRASEMGFAPLPLPRDSLIQGLVGKKSLEVKPARPERLVKMGQNWRASVSAQGQEVKS
ncbi:hypothetical protein BD324DRAFT_652803 [Kockovaella imperatae]|uniref:Uncharacterized protein n=1 Tax=Kockovaella imperatae TaxID=4999 RepID=A0A1Y1UC31_9TREE|nr:hypothetical protein BD324DRAFT_652803 [Kockovaella imperatae]ORX35087.1 hypothetical protein BD324DRAFT_652803 [Kockovaella imperatae]